MGQLTRFGTAYAPGPVDTNVSYNLGNYLPQILKYNQMWQEIDASIAERHGLKHGVAFAKSIEARSALKRAQVSEELKIKVIG